MVNELNQHDSSQPIEPVEHAESVGTNDAGKPSEPVVAESMTPSQSSDYYNKTQQLAQQRRELESERLRFETERKQYGYGQNTNQQGQYGQTANQYPANNVQAPVAPVQNPNDPAVFKSLVNQLGFEGAESVLHTFNQLAQPFQQQIQATQQQLQLIQQQNEKIQYDALVSQVEGRGKALYANEGWATKKDEVMSMIQTYGYPLEHAWMIANASNVKQTAIDQAYKNQQQKLTGNVASQAVAPANEATSEYNDIAAAFKAAWDKHAS